MPYTQPSELSEEELVAGLRRRTPAAFAGLHDAYAAGIYSLAMRMVRHASDAEDITQDVLLRAYERVPREREVMLRPWLYRLTLNRCYDHLRAASRRRTAEPADHEAAPATSDPFEQAELRRLFEAALLSLTRRQRAALLLKDVHGLTLVEVATAMSITPGSAEVQLARARNAFRASYEGLCRSEGRAVPCATEAPALATMLPLLSLPPALVVPPVLPAPAPASLPPLGIAAGGIGTAFGAPAAFKTAALVLAAAASVGTAGVAGLPSDTGQPGKQPAAQAAKGSACAPRSPNPAAGRKTPSPRPSARAAVSSPSPSATAVAEASPSPSASPMAEPSCEPRTGDASASPPPSPTAMPSPSPSVTPEPSPTPTPRATDEPVPSPTPSESPSTSPTPSPSPTRSPTTSATP
jgi:RNA polymerase sigma factor (sigma-70 family)